MPRLHAVMKKRILILVVIATAIFAGKTFIDISSDRSQTISSAERHSKGFASALNEHAVRTISNAESTLDALILEIKYISPSGMPDEKLLHHILGSFRNSSTFISTMFVLTPDGHMRAASSEYPVRALNLTDREYYQHHLKVADSELYISRPFKNRLNGTWFLTLSKRLSNPDGSLRMIVAVAIDPLYFSGFYSTIELGKHDRVLLVRRDGAILSQEPYSEQALGSNFSRSRLIAKELPRAPLSGTFQVEEGIIDKTSRIVSYRSSADYPVLSVVSLHKGDLLATWRQRAAKSASGALLLVVLVGALGLLIYRQVKELKRSEDKYSLIVTTANEGIWMQDSESRITYVNPRVADMFGYRPDEMIGRPIIDFMCKEELSDRAARMQLRRQGMSERYERRFLHKDGSVVWTLVSAASLIDDLDGFRGAVAMCTDITDRKRGEEQQARLAEQLRQAHKMEAVGILAGGMAHDFNNLLQSILGYIFLAKMSTDAGNDVHEYLEAAENVSGQACELGQRLLTLSRGGMTFTRVAPLPPIILTFVETVLAGTAVRGEFDLPDNLPLVTLDESQMQQVISHLTVNALEAMPADGTLKISARTMTISEQHDLPLPPGPYVHIRFNDSGAGIPAENLPRIFDPYFTTKENWNQKGLGLGLSLCHTIIRKHKGTITAESPPGEGATFNIYLPVAGGNEPAPSSKSEDQLSLSL